MQMQLRSTRCEDVRNVFDVLSYSHLHVLCFFVFGIDPFLQCFQGCFVVLRFSYGDDTRFGIAIVEEIVREGNGSNGPLKEAILCNRPSLKPQRVS